MMRRLRQSEVTPEMTNWALVVLHNAQGQIGYEESRIFGTLGVTAAVEVHTNGTAQNPAPHPHPGVSLFEADSSPITIPPAHLMKEGIDVSHYQKGMNWQTVKDAGKDFVFIKITEGVTDIDDMASDHWTKSGDVGMLRGGYLFLRARDDGAAQVEHYLNNVFHGSDLPHVIDIELDDHQPLSRVADCITAAVDRFHMAGMRPLIYTMPGFWNTLPTTELDADLWVAHWGVSSPAACKGWDHPLFWQYSSSAYVAGYPGHADVNRYMGDPETIGSLV